MGRANMGYDVADDMANNNRNNNTNPVKLSTLVGPGSLNNAQYSFNLKGWHVEDHSTFMIFEKELPPKFHEVIHSAISDLENILLALFINDHIPRKIFYFNFPNNLGEESRLRLLSILGNPHDPLVPDEELFKKSVLQGGWLFTYKPQIPIDTLPSNEAIENWFHFFSRNESVASSIGLIKEAFAMINRLSGSFEYHAYLELSSAIILLVSGLESLFFHNSDDHADISFKFRVIGAIYYEKYVTDEYLMTFGPNFRKLKFREMMTLLHHLYNTRSTIAHGGSQDVFRGNRKNVNKWNKFFKLLNIAPVEITTKGFLTFQISMSLGLLEKHLFALLHCSKENLSKGVKIIDEIFDE